MARLRTRLEALENARRALGQGSVALATNCRLCGRLVRLDDHSDCACHPPIMADVVVSLHFEPAPSRYH